MLSRYQTTKGKKQKWFSVLQMQKVVEPRMLRIVLKCSLLLIYKFSQDGYVRLCFWSSEATYSRMTCDMNRSFYKKTSRAKADVSLNSFRKRNVKIEFQATTYFVQRQQQHQHRQQQ